jgi:preprotein translocase subunit YajC
LAGVFKRLLTHHAKRKDSILSYLIDAAYAMGLPGGGEGEQGNPILGFLPIILMFVVLYLLMIRPQMKKQKNQQRMIDELEKGDEIVTSGGIHGSIANIKDDIIVLKIGDNVKIEVSRTAVSRNKSGEAKNQ